MKRKLTACCLAALLCGWAAAAQAGTLSLVGQTRQAHVAHVYDGDTFRTTDGEKIRLLGINAPEVAHHDRPGQPYGRQAKRRLEALIGDQDVRLRFDAEKRDGYKRLLAQVYLRDGRWVNGMLVREGLAVVYTFAPNVRRADALLEKERQARREHLGIWRHERFRILDAGEIASRHIGQFRLVKGTLARLGKWRFRLGRLIVSIPRASRSRFAGHPPAAGTTVLVRGIIRTEKRGRLYLALHSPFDIEQITPEHP